MVLVAKNPKAQTAPPLVIKNLPLGSLKKSLVIVVSSRVAKKASDRNLLKRRLRAIAMPALKKNKENYILIANPTASSMKFSELKAVAEKLMRKSL